MPTLLKLEAGSFFSRVVDVNLPGQTPQRRMRTVPFSGLRGTVSAPAGYCFAYQSE